MFFTDTIPFAPTGCNVGLSDVVEAVNWAVRRIIIERNGGKPGQGGGAFCLLLPQSGTDHLQILTLLIGAPNSARAAEYQDQALDNANHLADKPERSTSFLLRDPDTGCFGGAIRTPDFIMSFCGIDELADEAAMLLAAVKLEWMTCEQADSIANGMIYRRVAIACNLKPL